MLEYVIKNWKKKYTDRKDSKKNGKKSYNIFLNDMIHEKYNFQNQNS